MSAEVEWSRRLARPPGPDASSRELWLHALRSAIGGVIEGRGVVAGLRCADVTGMDSLDDALVVAAAGWMLHRKGAIEADALFSLTAKIWSHNASLLRQLVDSISQPGLLLKVVSGTSPVAPSASVLLVGMCGLVTAASPIHAPRIHKVKGSTPESDILQSLHLPGEVLDAILVAAASALVDLRASIGASGGGSGARTVDNILFIISRINEIDRSVWTRAAPSVMASIVSFCESISSINTEPSDSKEIDQAHLYWVNMVLHSVLGLIDCALSTNPTLATFRPLNEVLLYLTSDKWYLQELAFALLRYFIVHLLSSAPETAAKHAPLMTSSDADSLLNGTSKSEQSRSAKSKMSRASTDAAIKRPVGGGGAGAAAAGSSRAGGSSGLSALLQDLCANGHLWIICWALMHRRQSVRYAASFILQVFLELASANSAKVVNEFWISLIEQGLVSNLYCAVGGISLAVEAAEHDNTKPRPSVQQHMSTFPEPFISKIASDILEGLANVICGPGDDESAPVKADILQRTVMSLVFSRNAVLRGNVLSSIFLLISNHTRLKNVLWTARTGASDDNATTDAAGSPGGVFRHMLKTCIKDASEMKIIIDVLLHRLRWRLDSQQLSTPLSFVADKISDPHRAQVFVGPGKSKDTVWVMSSSNITGGMARAPGGKAGASLAHPVELVRPNLSIVNWHSPGLAGEIQELERSWADSNVAMKIATKAPLPADFRVLPGDYDIWQDAFSHMMDDYLLNTSAARADMVALLRLYSISELHDIPVLRASYVGAMCKKLSMDNVAQVLTAALGNIETSKVREDSGSSSSPKLHSPPIALILVRDSLAFLSTHSEALVAAKQNSKLRADIEALLFKYISMIFND